jgi:hypothetical protein
MSGSKLLEQAIVDAQALRDSAYKSAQAALVEKFAPQIKEAVEKLLEKEEDPAGMAGSPEDALAGDIPGGTDFGGAPPDTSDKSYVAGTAKDIPLAATDGEKLCACPDDEEEVELNINLADLTDQLKIGREAEEDEELSPQMTGMMDQPAASGGAGGPAPMMESFEIDEDLLSEEMDSAYASVQGDQNRSGVENKNVNMALEEDELTEVNLDEILSEEKEESEDEEESDEDEDEDEEEELDENIEEVKMSKDLAAAARNDSYKDKDKESEEQKKARKDREFRKANSQQRIAGLNESKTKQLLQASAQLLKEHENSIKLMEKKDAQIHNLLEENNKLSSTVEEMSAAFKKLEQVNTLNAKLFYENQVLKSASLNERQKTHIVEAISKADSVSEAKAMFETLINSVGGPQREERSPKSLNEAINKKSSFRLPHKQTEQPNDPNKDRWLKLAGIK